MNRKEAIKKLGDIIDDYWIEIEEKGIDDEEVEVEGYINFRLSE